MYEPRDRSVMNCDDRGEFDSSRGERELVKKESQEVSSKQIFPDRLRIPPGNVTHAKLPQRNAPPKWAMGPRGASVLPEG